MGAFRGNYLERRGRVGWEYPQHRLVQHRSLGAYRLVEGEPRQTKVIQHSDGPVKYPHAVGRHLDASFYRDLEQCHVAFVFTHGGPIDGVYQVQRGLRCLGGVVASIAETGRRQSAAPVPGTDAPRSPSAVSRRGRIW